MNEARIGVFVGSPDLRNNLHAILEPQGHLVAVSTPSLVESRLVVPQLEPGDLQIAMVARNKHNPRNQGANLARFIHYHLGEIPVIGLVHDEYETNSEAMVTVVIGEGLGLRVITAIERFSRSC